MSILTKDETEILVSLLDKCDSGNLPPEVFEAVARVAVYPAIEFIPLRKKNNKTEVLLFERPSYDLMWPSMFHTPGTILRPTDATYQDAFDRLYKDELMNLETAPPFYMGTHLSRNKRGTCVLIEYILDVKGEPVAGTFYDVDNLPELFIEDQKPSLERAVATYRSL